MRTGPVRRPSWADRAALPAAGSAKRRVHCSQEKFGLHGKEASYSENAPSLGNALEGKAHESGNVAADEVGVDLRNYTCVSVSAVERAPSLARYTYRTAATAR